MEISVMLTNLLLPFEQALDAVNELGLSAIQPSFGPEDDAARRQYMVREIAAHGLKVSSFHIPIHDFAGRDGHDALEAAKPLLDAVAETGTDLCQSHIGVVPHSGEGPIWDQFVRVGTEMAAYAEKAGVRICMETGPEPPAILEKLLKTIGSPALGINYDPANLILWPSIFTASADYAARAGIELAPYDKEAAYAKFEPMEGVKRLGPYIMHTHAKDAVPEVNGHDVPLGTGWVDWPYYLRSLREQGFDGYLAIEREAGPDPKREIGEAVSFLREQLKNLDA